LATYGYCFTIVPFGLGSQGAVATVLQQPNPTNGIPALLTESWVTDTPEKIGTQC